MVLEPTLRVACLHHAQYEETHDVKGSNTMYIHWPLYGIKSPDIDVHSYPSEKIYCSLHSLHGWQKMLLVDDNAQPTMHQLYSRYIGSLSTRDPLPLQKNWFFPTPQHLYAPGGLVLSRSGHRYATDSFRWCHIISLYVQAAKPYMNVYCGVNLCCSFLPPLPGPSFNKYTVEIRPRAENRVSPSCPYPTSSLCCGTDWADSIRTPCPRPMGSIRTG